jgi:DNA invertase Pin-like site-specific DNA recombinase
VVKVYSDNGVAGAKGRTQRPGLDAMLRDAARGRFDEVLAWALDRLGRSLIDLLDTLNELETAAMTVMAIGPLVEAIPCTHQRRLLAREMGQIQALFTSTK